jgi:hypothetical protein
MIASFAAAQDWDGVFLFDYHASADWSNLDAMRTYFSIDTNPVKMAEMAAGALLFRRGDIAPLPVSVVTGLTPDRLAALMAHRGAYTEAILADSQVAAPPAARFFGRYALAPFDFGAKEESKSSPATMILEPNKSRLALPPPDAAKGPVDWKSADGKLRWTAGKERGTGIFTAEGERSAVAVGFLEGRELDVGQVTLKPKKPLFAALTFSSLDGLPLLISKRILVVVAGRTENSGQAWNDSRTSVGDRWGNGPTLIELLETDIRVWHKEALPMTILALDGKGKPAKEGIAFYPIPRNGGDIIGFCWGIDHYYPATVWYVLEIENK